MAYNQNRTNQISGSLNLQKLRRTDIVILDLTHIVKFHMKCEMATTSEQRKMRRLTNTKLTSAKCVQMFEIPAIFLKEIKMLAAFTKCTP